MRYGGISTSHFLLDCMGLSLDVPDLLICGACVYYLYPIRVMVMVMVMVRVRVYVCTNGGRMYVPPIFAG